MSHYNRSFTPAQQLLDPLPNFYNIWFKTDEISKRRSSYKCQKIFIWFSWETIFGFRYMFLVCSNSDFFISIFNQKYPQAFLKYPKEYLRTFFFQTVILLLLQGDFFQCTALFIREKEMKELAASDDS